MSLFLAFAQEIASRKLRVINYSYPVFFVIGCVDSWFEVICLRPKNTGVCENFVGLAPALDEGAKFQRPYQRSLRESLLGIISGIDVDLLTRL